MAVFNFETQEAFDKGYEAYWDDNSTNPYNKSEESELWRAWQDGYGAAFDEDEEGVDDDDFDYYDY